MIWASPLSAIALLLALPCIAFGARALTAQSVDTPPQLKALIIHGSACRVLLRILVPWLKVDGITLGHVIFVNTDDKALPAEWLMAHELIHTQQWAAWGVFFPFAYGLASIHAVIQRGHYYRDNVFEKQARQGETTSVTAKIIR